MNSSNNHEYVVLKCAQKEVKIKLPSPDNWSLNLKSILERIPHKFKFLSNIDELQVLLSVNKTIINKQDPQAFGQILSNQIPIPVINISQNIVNADLNDNDQRIYSIKYLKIHYKTSFMDWKPSNLNKKRYNELINVIKKHFAINDNNIYLQDQNSCDIMDDYDLDAYLESLKNNEAQQYTDIFVIHDVDINANGIQYSHSGDINDEINAIINDMKLQEINSLKHAIDVVDNGDIGKMDWIKACKGLTHEMWPKIASTVTAIISDTDKNLNQFDEENIDKVIQILKDERHLAIEERHYLTAFLHRALQFTPVINISQKAETESVNNFDVEKR
eukprot:333761_1